MRLVRFAVVAAALVAPVLCFGQVARRDLDGKGKPVPPQQSRIEAAINSMRARAVYTNPGEIGETGEWIPTPTESVLFASNGTDFGASLDVALLAADTAANATAVSNVIIADPRVNSVTSILTTAVTPTAAEMSAFDVVMVWTNSTPLSNVTLGDNLATYIDSGGGCVLTMFAIRASIATRTIGGRFLTDNYYCIAQSVGASTTGAATLNIALQSSELVDGVNLFNAGTSGFRTPALPLPNAVVAANWSTSETLIAHRDDLNGGRVDLNFFCLPGTGWDPASDGRMVMVNALSMASKQNLWHTLASQTPFNPTGGYRNSNMPGISAFSDQQWADDFTLAQGGIVTDLRLWAVYTNGSGTSEPPPALQDMTVRFFADNAGQPGTLVGTSTGQVLTFRDTGVDNTSAPSVPRRVYEYRVSLFAPFVADPGVKYWISPLGNTAGKTWSWVSATNSGTSAFRVGDAGAWATSANPGRMAMVVGSDEFHFGNEVTAFTFSNAVRGNLITVNDSQVLDRIVMRLRPPVGGATLYFYVLEANTTAGPFTPIFTRSAPFIASVVGWYSSGRLNAILNPNKVYLVGVGWNTESVEFYRDSGLSAVWPLGSRLGSGGLNAAANPLVGPQAILTNGVGIEYDMRLSFSVAQTCYANCDGSSGNPLLTANDFQCFINAFAAGQPYANCDGSVGNPQLTANDFQCFIDAFAAGCP